MSGNNNEQPQSQEKKDIGSADFKDMPPSLLEKIFRRTKKLECIVWAIFNETEIALYTTKVKLGEQQFTFKGKIYNIDQSAIQNKFGKLIYNCAVNNAVGALRFVKPQVNRDAKNARELLARNWLTALWGQWKLPFLLLMVSLGICILLAVLLAIFLPSYLRVDEENELLKLQVQELTNQLNTPKIPDGGNVTPIPQGR